MLSDKEKEEIRKRYGLSPVAQTEPTMSPRMSRLSSVAEQGKIDQDPRAGFVEPKKDGFVKSTAKFFLKAPVTIGASAYKAAKGTGDILTSGAFKALGKDKLAERYKTQAYEGVMSDKQNVPGFGEVETLNVEKPQKAISTGLDLASNIVGGGAASGVVKAGVKGAIFQGMKQGGKLAAASGLVGGAGRKLGEVESAPEFFGLTDGVSGLDVLKQGVGEGIVGGVAGTALGGLSGGVGALVKKAITPKEVAIVAKRSKELGVLENSYKDLRKQITKAKADGFDLNKLLAESDLLTNSVDENGVIRTPKAIHELQDFMKPYEDIVGKRLDDEGVKIPLDLVKKRLRDTVKNGGVEGEALESALSKVERELAGLARRTDESGLITLSKIHDAKVFKYGNIDYFNPQNKQADKIIAKGLKEIIEENSKIGAKELNKDLSQFYKLQKYLETLDGKRVQGGKLGKYFGQTLGAIAGAKAGPLGSIAGAEIGRKVAERSMMNKFGQKLGTTLKPTQVMKESAEKLAAPKIQLGAAKVNEILNDITPGLSSKATFNLTFAQNGKKGTMRAIPKEELGGWLKYLEEKGIKYTIKAAGVGATAAAIARQK